MESYAHVFGLQLSMATLFLSLFVNCKEPNSLINDTIYDLDCPQMINFGLSNTYPMELSQLDPLLTVNCSCNSQITLYNEF